MKFNIGEKVVVPAHGIGVIQKIETHTIMGFKAEYYIVFFKDENLSISVSVDEAHKKGIRKICNKNELNEILNILESTPVFHNNLTWNQKSQYLLHQLNSGELTKIATIARDLGKNIYKTLSYKENIILNDSIERLSKEIAIMSNISIEKAEELIKNNLYNTKKPEKKSDIKENLSTEFV